MQTSYDLDFAVAAYPGQLADTGPHDVMTGLSLRTPAKLVTITVANTTAYTFTFEQGAVDPTATYTSDSSATKAEIVAGLIAAVATASPKDWQAVNHGGDLVLVARPAGLGRAVTSTGAGTMTLATLSPEIAFGAAVAVDASAAGQPLSARLPNSATDNIAGVALSTHALESLGRFASDPTAAPAYPSGSDINICRSGRVYCKPEEAVTAGDPVYFVYAGTPGALRKSPKGTAQVTTYTPTAGTSATYQVAINGRAFQYLGDGTDTATEVVTALTALINADTDLPVTASGSSTLILTADTAGVAFLTSATANMSAAATTPNVSQAALLPGAKWLDSASASAFSRLQLNLP